jgi:hypothetical protein
VVQALSLKTNLSAMYLNQLKVNVKSAKKVGSLMDPLMGMLFRFEALFGQ